ncbi:MAG: hypothetical protein IJ876_00605 [Elusimicrobiaceae bacterium]|nr:hypothetical protein [Elusimicrobiaceae bacterium]
MKHKLFVVALLFFCSFAWAEEFPICMYGVNKPEDIPLIKQAGFTCIRTYSKDSEKLTAIAQTAKDNNIQLVIYSNQAVDTPCQEMAKDWPMLAWYLADEPDVHKLSRERVTEIHKKSKEIFPNHQTALVIGQGKTVVPYYDLSDILMVDWYPVPHLPLTSFGDNVRLAKEGQESAGVGNRPLWGVVQAFDWKEYQQYRPDNDRIGRFPTEAEIRFMSYDGILNGATGLFYYTFGTKDGTLASAHPDWWTRVVSVSQELNKLLPVLENGKIVENPFTVAGPLTAQTRLYKKYKYIILLNRSDKPVNVPKTLLKRNYQLLVGSEKFPQMPAYGAWVIKKRNSIF